MFRRLLVVALILPAGCAHADAPAVDPALRAEFRVALAAAEAGGDGSGDGPALRGYVLYPYVEAARLRRGLRATEPRARAASDAAIEAFLSRAGDVPVANALRRDWLLNLAERREWATFLDAWRPTLDSNTALRCRSFEARIALRRLDGLADAVAATWLAPKSLPGECDAAFDWLRSTGRLDDGLVEQRARLALAEGESGLARFLARGLPAARAAPLTQWAQLIEQPQAALDALIDSPARSVEPEALRMGLDRLARRDQDAAMQRHAALVATRQLDSREAGRLAAPIGLWLALNRRGEALEWFAKAAPEHFGEREHEWHARAAAWAGDWPRLQAAIAAMPTELREQSRWRYWAARAAQGRGDTAAARSGFEAVLPTDNWYAVLSAARLGREFAPTPRPLPFDQARIAALAGEPAMLRARELYALERPEAGSEWRWGFERLERDAQVQALALPARWGRHLEAIAAAATLGLFDDYAFLYPRPFDREVRMGVDLARVPPELIYAVLRQESLYRADARSSAGALGLMQMLPTTAAAAARRFGRPEPSRSELLVPSINVPLGAAELRILLDRFDGQLPVAIAGYNAGPANARRWLPATPRDIDVWVENIPFNETRSYVQRVSWHSLVFGWQQDGRARDVGAWLGRIQPAQASPTEAAEGR